MFLSQSSRVTSRRLRHILQVIARGNKTMSEPMEQLIGGEGERVDLETAKQLIAKDGIVRFHSELAVQKWCV